MATTGKDAAEPEREQPNRATAQTPDDVNTPKPPPPQPQQHQQQREQPSPSLPQPSPPPPPPPPPPVDGESYYGYLFNNDKTATDLLDALLRAIARYIACNIGDRKSTGLDPKKLAAFYHAVGGDYDALFLNAPAKSISYIWQALGVQHVLQQPAGNCYVEPSVPALTVEGFVRWETIQILLEPEEHAPFMQFAVRNWALRHPDTGEPFPPDLPRKAFPATCDPQIDKWHRSCAERLKQEAALQEEQPPQPSHPPQQSPQPSPARDPRVHAGFNHVHGSQVKNTSPRRRHEMDYFSRDRPARVVHIPVRRVSASHHTSPRPPNPRRVDSSSEEEPRRCRSYSDLRPPPDPNVRFSTRLNARAPPAPRRHSQPRPYSPSSDSESDSGSDALPRSTSTSRLYSHVAPTPPRSIRLRSHPPPPTAATSARPHRPEVLPNDHRRRSLPAEIKHKITSLLSGSHDRHRSSSREHTSGGPSIRPRYTRETPPSRRGRHGLSDGSYPSDESDSGVSPKRRSSRERERERARRRQVHREVERERKRERELAEEREMRSRSREERVYLRPTAAPRPSSHADAERIPRDFAWERDRDRGGDWDRAGRRVTTSSEREQRDLRRRKSYGTSPIKGVTGRRYPAEPPWT